MKFYIESLTRIQEKVYVMVRSLKSGFEFQLSDTSFLGPVAIENWVEIPRSIDQEAGKPDTSCYLFVLKNASDILKLEVGVKYPLRDINTKVLESGLTVSGRIFVILQCNTGLIEVGARLISSNGDVWTIVENNLTIGRLSDQKLHEKILVERMFLYNLEERHGTTLYPQPGSILQVEFL